MSGASLAGAFTITTAVSLALSCMAEVPRDTDIPAEPEFLLVDQASFDSESQPGWSLPHGWNQVAAGEGYALSIAAGEAGLQSAVEPDGVFSDVEVQADFTFTGFDGTAQLWARCSAAGAYLAQLDAVGRVTLQKYDDHGAVIATWNANAEPQSVAGAARVMQLSTAGGGLRVTVDAIDVLTVDDTKPLPSGTNKVGAIFTTPTGVLLFDNYLVWAPADEAPMRVRPTSPPPKVSASAAMSQADPPPPPPNDLFVDRLVAVGERYSTSGNTAGATANESGEPVPATAADTSGTVWYEFTPPSNKLYRLTTFGSSFNTVLAVYTGAWGSLSQVAFSDDVTGSQQAQMNISLDSATTYYIQLGGRNSSGNFTFRIMDPADAVVPSTPTIGSTAAGAPSDPVANLGQTNNMQPVLAWVPRPTVTPYAYLAEVSTAANFSSILSSGTVVDPTRFWEITPALSTPPAAGQKYYWRVSAMNFQGQASLPSTAYSFILDTTPPLAPALLSPALNGVVTNLRPVFTWQAAASAVKYRHRIASNFSGATPIGGGDAIITGLTRTPTFDVPQGEYWYCVEAQDAAGNWSGFVGEKRHFLINVSLTPANGANIIASPPSYTPGVTLTWTKITGATYDLQIADDSSFSGFVRDFTGLAGNSYTVANLPVGTYFWRVAVNGQQLPMSLARRFNVTPVLPVAPVIQTIGALPGAVTNNGFTNNQTPRMDWTVPANWASPAPGSSITYELQVSTNSTFTELAAPAVTGIAASDYEWQTSTLAPGIYYWRVRAVTNLGLPGAFSAAYKFTIDTTPPTAPLLASPAVNGIVATERPTFTWKPVGDANRYRIRIATDASATTPIADGEVELTTTTFTPAFNIPQGEYWYSVESRDAAGNWSGLGEIRRFVINVCLTPAPGAAVIALAPSYTSKVLLTWTKVAGVTYKPQIDDSADFSSPISGIPLLSTTSYTLPNLPIGTYYWRVLITGQPSLSPPVVRTFHVTPALPVAPLIQTTGTVTGAVTHGGFTNDQTPIFDWKTPANWTSPPSGSSISYELQLAKNSTFTQMVASSVTGLTNSDYEWQGAPLEPGTYYWRVRAITNLGLSGAFSPAYSFTVDTTAPAAPVLLAPALNGVVSTLRPTITWKAVSDAKRYFVRIATNFSVSTPQAGGEAELSGLSFTPGMDIPQGEYWYSVKAQDAAGNWGEFGEKRRFVINVSLTPAQGANLIAVAPAYSPKVVLTWSKIPGATYDLEVAYDSSFSSWLVNVSSLTSTSYTIPNLPVGTYFWRVSVAGNPLPASLARRFNVTPALPVAPAIQTSGSQPGAVPNAGSTTDTTPMLDWTVPTNWVTPPSGSSLTYELQLSISSSFTTFVDSPVSGLATSYHEWASTLPPGIYYWRVRAITNLGLPGPFSAVYRFTVR